MGRFLKTHVLGDKEGKHLLAIDYSKPYNQLSMSQMEVGEKTRSALSKLSDDQQKKKHAVEQTKECSNKRVELDKNKKRLLEDYSKHLSTKREKTKCGGHLYDVHLKCSNAVPMNTLRAWW